MKEFQAGNPKLAQTMQTHLIYLDAFGIWNDDFDTFLERRCERISHELAERVIRRSVEDGQQPVDLNDVEEVGGRRDQMLSLCRVPEETQRRGGKYTTCLWCANCHGLLDCSADFGRTMRIAKEAGYDC